MNQAEKI